MISPQITTELNSFERKQEGVIRRLCRPKPLAFLALTIVIFTITFLKLSLISAALSSSERTEGRPPGSTQNENTMRSMMIQNATELPDLGERYKDHQEVKPSSDTPTQGENRTGEAKGAEEAPQTQTRAPAPSPENDYCNAAAAVTSEASTAAGGPPRLGQVISMCNDAATARGPAQRVVSFSFYGPQNSKYFTGIKENTGLVEKFYPDWTMRVYHDIPARDAMWKELCRLPSLYPHLDLCNISHLPLNGNIHGSQQNTWRFLPMADPLVDVFVSRDLDARLSARERAAVDEWLGSPLPFHLMRDHPWHSTRILAGMWGVKVKEERRLTRDLYLEILKRGAKAGAKSEDQKLLSAVVWPAIKGKVLQHDSYFCQSKGYLENGNMRPFPTQRLTTEYNFVGVRSNVDRKPITKECPKACRPANHTDWKIC